MASMVTSSFILPLSTYIVALSLLGYYCIVQAVVI